MPSWLSAVEKAGPTGRLLVCLVVTGLIMVIQGAIFVVFCTLSSYQFVLIGVGADILLISTSICIYTCIKGLKLSRNQPSYTLKVN